ncbi:amino acid permease [Sphingomonas canadensis]|uniref:Arginine/agmatine antiporter n=1 Tax=Sphingomonas canadensis TaxID=1219257 RepID=A0ABW3H8Y1_9SPHN|nr:amino acid permease [Sphingomonas canadensis]MCW3837093.1 amino acid permease [Sphingomonas canadensis]
MSDKRELGFWTCLALVVGNLIGSGVYLLPANLAPLGPNALLGWIVTIAGAMCLAFVFARLSARLPLAGGPYAFVNAAFGPVAGFAVAWSYWVMLWSGNAAVAVAAVSALSLAFPALQAPLPAAATALAISWSLILVNIRGVGLAGMVQLVTSVLKLIPLAGVVLLGAWILLRDGTAAVQPMAAVPVSAGGIAAAAALVFWGFLGLESATVPADKVEDAGHVVPRTTLLGTMATGVIYLAIAAAVGLLMPWQVTGASPAPLAEFLGRELGSGTAQVIALFAAISAIGTLNGFTLVTGEMPWAMAKGGVFPAWFAGETAQGTPARAHLLSGALATCVLLLNYTGGSATQLFADVATISLAAGMVAYFASALAAIRLLPGDRTLTLLSLVSVVFVLWMIWGLGTRACLWGIGLIALGLPVYFWVRHGTSTADPA